MLRAIALVLLAVVTACSGGADGALPAAPEVLAKAAEAMKKVSALGFTIETEGRPPVQVRRADGNLTREGDAKGTVQIDVLGSLQELEFVLVGDTVHFKGPTGGYQRMSRADLARLYDPSAILDPARGVPALLSNAADARTEAEERVGSADAYRVAVTLSQQSLAALVPGVRQDVKGQVWIEKSGGRLLKASLPMGEGDASGTVIVTLTDYDVPVTVTPPAG
jgi:Protein of unknown function (DUF1396).